LIAAIAQLRRRAARWLSASRGISHHRETTACSWSSPRLADLRFTAALGVVTCSIFGLVPAIRATGMAPGAAMKAGSADRPTARALGMRRALVVAQVAAVARCSSSAPCCSWHLRKI